MKSFAIVALAALIAYGLACTCKTKNLTERYCESDYVARVRITDFFAGPNANYTTYTFDALREYKGENNTFDRFITPSTSGACAIQWLSADREYVINAENSNGTLYTNYCLQFSLNNQSTEYTNALSQRVLTLSQNPNTCS